MYHLISHVVFQNDVEIYGPIHVLEKYLKDRKKDVSFKKYQLSSSPKKWINEFFDLFSYMVGNRVGKKDIVIAVDPLNCLPFALLKPLIGYQLIYYTVDYSDKRFANPILDVLYKIFDRLCLNFCNVNWCVSETIVEKRKKQGYREKVRFLPNTPILDEKPKLQDKKFKENLIYVGRMDENMKIWELLKCLSKIYKKGKEINLTLIGSGSNDEKIKKFIKENKLSNSVLFLGPLPNDKVISNLKKSGIGIALYSGGNLWNKYGDSMKIREYQYFGLPVITTTIPSNFREIIEYKCGFVYEPEDVTIDNLEKAIEDIQKDYSLYTTNTKKLANIRMKDEMLNNLLNI